MLRKMSRRLSLITRVARYGHIGRHQPKPMEQITAEELAEIKAFFPMDKFFVFGHARSGTTLLARLIRVHPEIHCNYQAHFFSRPPLLSGVAADPAISVWFSRPSNRWNRGKNLSTPALRAMADFILERDARVEGARIVGDKSPNVLLNGQAIHEMNMFYPEAKVVYIVRDGRDALISHRFQHFIDGYRHLRRDDLRIRDAFEANPDPFLSGKRSIFNERSIHKMADSWASNVTETDREGREIYGDRYYALKYEDLLTRPFETISGVWQFLGGDPAGLETLVDEEMSVNPDADYQNDVASGLVRLLEKGKRGSWRELFTERDKRVFKEIAGQVLIDWGYEPDMEW